MAGMYSYQAGRSASSAPAPPASLPMQKKILDNVLGMSGTDTYMLLDNVLGMSGTDTYMLLDNVLGMTGTDTYMLLDNVLGMSGTDTEMLLRISCC